MLWYEKTAVCKSLRNELQWTDVPVDLQDDRDMVLAALRRNIVNWHDLPPKWKNDVEVICATRTFEKYRVTVTWTASGRSIREITMYEDDPFDDDDTSSINPSLSGHKNRTLIQWKDLPYHLMTNEKVLIAALHTGIQIGPTWNQVPLKMRQNPEILYVALVQERIKFEDVPDHLRSTHRQIAFWCVMQNHVAADDCTCFDDEFLRHKIENKELQWTQLPTNLRTDANFAKSISFDKKNNIRHHRDEILRDILASIPALAHDASFWRSHKFPNLMTEFESVQLSSNRAFMLEACTVNSNVFRRVDTALARDHEFLLELLAKNVTVLQHLDYETQLLYPLLVKNHLGALGKLPPNNLSTLMIQNVARAIEPSFWLQYEFIMEWVSVGLGIFKELPQEVYDAWIRNRDVALANAIHYSGVSGLPEMHFYPIHAFRHDCDFMVKVVECHPRLYKYASGEARRDPWVLTVARAGSSDFAKEFLLDRHLNGFDDHVGILRFLRARMSAFETFTRLILGNMLSTQSIEDTGSNLTMLNQGMETSLVFRQSLAAYLDIPTGKTLRIVRNAEKNVSDAVAFWTSGA